MPIRNYPFIALNRNTLPRPFLIVRVTNPATGASLRTLGLVDTGADDCAMPAPFAQHLGLNLTQGNVRTIGTGNGPATAYTHICNIEIFDTVQCFKNIEQIVHSITNAPVDFMLSLHCTLLGVRSFLGAFHLKINYPGQILSITNPSLIDRFLANYHRRRNSLPPRRKSQP